PLRKFTEKKGKGQVDCGMGWLATQIVQGVATRGKVAGVHNESAVGKGASAQLAVQSAHLALGWYAAPEDIIAQQVQPGHGRSARDSPFRRWHVAEHLRTVLERANRLRPLLAGEPVVTLTKLRHAWLDGIAAGWCQPVSTLPLADVVDGDLYAGHL